MVNARQHGVTSRLRLVGWTVSFILVCGFITVSSAEAQKQDGQPGTPVGVPESKEKPAAGPGAGQAQDAPTRGADQDDRRDKRSKEPASEGPSGSPLRKAADGSEGGETSSPGAPGSKPDSAGQPVKEVAGPGRSPVAADSESGGEPPGTETSPPDGPDQRPVKSGNEKAGGKDEKSKSGNPWAGDSKDSPEPDRDSEGVPLIVAGQEVFSINVKLGPYTPEIRVQSVQKRLENLVEDPAYSRKVDSITTREGDYSTDIVCGDLTIMTVTSSDAKAAGAVSRSQLAQAYAERLRVALRKDIEEHSFKALLIGAALTVLTTVVLALALVGINWVFPAVYNLIRSWKGKYIRPLKFQQAQLLSEDTIVDLLLGTFRILRVASVLLLLFVYVPLVLSFFPSTRPLAGSIVGSLVNPVVTVIWPAIISYLPNILFIAIILFLTYYVVTFTHFIFQEIERGSISFAGFDPEWAEPTYKIVRFLIVAFSIVLMFPYLPGSGTPAFQQVSIFLGVLLSLGSTGAVAHIVAGIFLTYTGAFRCGDRVKIADTVGDVVEKTLLATRIRTIKHEYITIPNGLILGSHIINYSSSGQNPGLILHTTVTIGYDVPWRQVHRLLIDAALETALILPEPVPFVLQTSLDDFYVSYQLNAYTSDPSLMAVTYSQLHQNIQDQFNAGGVEIMSPHYGALRDGNKTTVAEDHLPASYCAPGFVVNLQSSGSK